MTSFFYYSLIAQTHNFLGRNTLWAVKKLIQIWNRRKKREEEEDSFP